MMPGLQIKVSGHPIPKQSFKASTHTGKITGYTPERVKAWQNQVAMAAIQAMFDSELDMYQDELQAEIVFLLPDKKRRDLDNLSKAVLDAMNGIVYKDDKQIQKLMLSKVISKDNPGVIIRIWKSKEPYLL